MTGDQVLLSLRGLSMEPSAPEDDMLSVQVWTNGSRIITCRDWPAQAISDLRRDIEHGHGPIDTGEFLLQLAERLVSAMDDLIDGAEADTDRLGYTGERGNTGALVEELAGIRRRMIRLGRYLGPAAACPDPPGRLAPDMVEPRGPAPCSTPPPSRPLSTRTAWRSALEVAEITQDELLQRSSEKTEQRVYVLTLISAVFMPMSFVTGLFGVNLAGIPAAENPRPSSRSASPCSPWLRCNS